MRFWLALGALLAGSAVAAGAVGAHALELPAESMALWETAVRFQMYHALALIALGVLQAAGLRSVFLTLSGLSLLAGLGLFCGALYATAAGYRPFVSFAPYGGSAFMFGWLLFALGSLFGAIKPNAAPATTDRAAA